VGVFLFFFFGVVGGGGGGGAPPPPPPAPRIIEKIRMNGGVETER